MKLMLKKTGSATLAIFLLLLCCGAGRSQQADSVDVTFFYTPAGTPTIVYLPGEFNNWADNQDGRIFDSRFAMSKDPMTGVWSKTERLRLGGPDPLPNPGLSVPGAYQYKFNENGSSTGWLSDPLNPRRNHVDFNNSYVFVKDPTIHYLLPNSVSGAVASQTPKITAYIFPALASEVDTGSIRLTVDTTEYANLGAFYDADTKLLSFTVPDALVAGTHTLKLFVRSSTGSTNTDSTTFEVVEQPGFVSFLTRSNERELRASKTVAGTVGAPAWPVTLVINDADSVNLTADASGEFSHLLNLVEGDNVIRAVVTDTLGMPDEDEITITYFVGHAPKPQAFVSLVSTDILKLTFAGNDPDDDALSAHWSSDDEINPEPLAIDSQDPEVIFDAPQTPGEYYVDLVVTDPDSNIGTARSYFIIKPPGQISFASVNKNPHWVQDAVIYEIFLPAFTAEGTLQAARQRLPNIKSLGANVIWLMPIYENGEAINPHNAGYNITDFFKVHPQLGTMADFQAFLADAHEMGIRVILDTTPNHVSEQHPWVKDVEKFRDFSNFRRFLETEIKGDNRGLGQTPKLVGGYVVYVHYSNWTLANLDYDNIEAVDYMLNMYKYWVLEQGVDGYRMDVYWGPQNRYGRSKWWRPFRDELKRVRPDVFILSETDGTGSGSENNYADFGGASDAAYDWSLFGEFKNTMRGGSISGLHDRIVNFSPNVRYNHFTGVNSHYLRFLENHDETRIAEVFSSDFQRTKAGAAVLLTTPGIPMLYAGQEVGETSRRGLIDWNRAGAQSTFLYYQRLVAIRNRFETFRSNELLRVGSSESRVYAYLRPRTDQNGFGVTNFSGNTVTTTLSIKVADLQLSTDSLLTSVTYYMNDVLNDTSYVVDAGTLASFDVQLQPWGSAIFVLADSTIELVTSVAGPLIDPVPETFELFQNYPNPFNPSTNIRFRIAETAHVRLEVYNILGARVRTILDEVKTPGEFTLRWDGKNDRGLETPSGLYVVRMIAEPSAGFSGTQRAVQSLKLIKLK